jgi:nucleoid-associated protein YgaU
MPAGAKPSMARLYMNRVVTPALCGLNTCDASLPPTHGAGAHRMSPQNTKDPGDLSLRPSASAGGGKTADFSNVKGQSGTVPGSGPTGSGKTADFSNVHGNADTVPAGTSANAGSYTVQKGDTLSAIAQQHYGKASRWHEIFEANRDQIEDPDMIRPGQVLKLPAKD